MDAQPDLTLLSDDELKETIRRLTAQERDLSRRRRLLHGRIELLKSELVGRLKGRDERELAAVDVDALSRILAGRLPDLDRLEGPVALDRLEGPVAPDRLEGPVALDRLEGD